MARFHDSTASKGAFLFKQYNAVTLNDIERKRGKRREEIITENHQMLSILSSKQSSFSEPLRPLTSWIANNSTWLCRCRYNTEATEQDVWKKINLITGLWKYLTMRQKEIFILNKILFLFRGCISRIIIHVIICIPSRSKNMKISWVHIPLGARSIKRFTISNVMFIPFASQNTIYTNNYRSRMLVHKTAINIYW